jgi:hypothetical protein
MQWNDATSYSRDGNRTPRWWETKIASLRVSVGNSHIYYPTGDTWIMHCRPWFDTYVLKAKTEVEAKKEALELVAVEVRKIQEALVNG